ncbi:hypothetical protein D9M71_516510 [compost metagenome]
MGTAARLALLVLHVDATHVRVHAWVDHLQGIARVGAIFVADRIQREARTLLEARHQVPALLHESGVGLLAGQRLGIVGPIHVTGEKRRGMGNAHRGHRIHQAEELHAHIQARQFLHRLVRPLGRYE